MLLGGGHRSQFFAAPPRREVMDGFVSPPRRIVWRGDVFRTLFCVDRRALRSPGAGGSARGAFVDRGTFSFFIAELPGTGWPLAFRLPVDIGAPLCAACTASLVLIWGAADRVPGPSSVCAVCSVWSGDGSLFFGVARATASLVLICG